MTKRISVIKGPLRISNINPRYFTDDSGKAVYLTGSHTWNNLQDRGVMGAEPAVFDYDAYLDLLETNHHNFFRLWHFEGWCGETLKTQFAPMPFKRTGPGNALDGGLKYDVEVADYPAVDRFNQAYFDRMRERVAAACDRGIYAAVMLFQGWSIDHYATDPWPGHPFNPENNVNFINGDYSGNGNGTDCHRLNPDHPMGQKILAIQEAYVRKVIDTVNDLDNVLYEISNEDNGTLIRWQYRLVNFIKAYEAGMPKQHPVGITAGDCSRGATNDQLTGSEADWISPGYYNHAEYKSNPTAESGSKVVLADTDHIWGIGGDDLWVWKSFLQGLNPIFMDPMDENTLKQYSDISPGVYPGILSARLAMGDARTYADRVNLMGMTPRGSLSSTGYCLAEAGAEYLVLRTESHEFFSVELPAGTYRAEWWSLDARSVTSGQDIVATGGQVSFTAPFSGVAVLYLKLVG